VNAMPVIYDQHYEAILSRIRGLVEKDAQEQSFDGMCQMVVDLLGPDALIECATMNAYQVAQAILDSSSGQALLADLRQNWESGTSDGEKQDTSFFQDMNLREYIENLASYE
jgi:hypothetical protein